MKIRVREVQIDDAQLALPLDLSPVWSAAEHELLVETAGKLLDIARARAERARRRMLRNGGVDVDDDGA